MSAAAPTPAALLEAELRKSNSNGALCDRAANLIQAQSREIERLRAENYLDLIAQARESWGEEWRSVARVEWEAFIDSRHVHTPTRSLRARAERLTSGLRSIAEMHVSSTTDHAQLAALMIAIATTSLEEQ